MQKFLLFFILLNVCACALTIDFDNGTREFNITRKLPTDTVLLYTTDTPYNNFSAVTFSPPPNDNPEKLIRFGSGEVKIPILLYHHVLQGQPSNSYSVSKSNFIHQMDFLVNNGYQTITLNDLVEAIKVGKELPLKPIIITFDDGNQNIFLNAFPILKERGLNGVVLIIANRIGATGYLSVDELKELVDAGWEIGSHGMRHLDLIKEPQALRDEIMNSKKNIEAVMGMPISIFAYPYGKANRTTIDWVKRVGYKSALGLGISNIQSPENLYYLERREVKDQFSLVQFASLLENNE